MLLINITGLDQRLLGESVVASMDAVRRGEGRQRVYYHTRDDLARSWEAEVESAFDRELRRASLPGINDEARLNIEFGQWRVRREERVLVIVQLLTDLDWTYDLRLKMLVLIGRNLSHFLPKDWYIEALTQSRGDDAHLFARAGSLCDGDAASEDARA